jgi:hypothetical protein
MKSIYVEIYHQRLYDEDAERVKHSLEFDGKEFKVLGMIPHASKIIIDKENIAILRSILDKIENDLEPNPRTTAMIALQKLLTKADTSTLQKITCSLMPSAPCGSCIYECDEEECKKRKKKDYSCYVYSD